MEKATDKAPVMADYTYQEHLMSMLRANVHASIHWPTGAGKGGLHESHSNNSTESQNS
jgi:hypothetical protein